MKTAHPSKPAARKMPPPTLVGNQDDTEYDAYLQRLRDRFRVIVDHGLTNEPLFTTDAAGLWGHYLLALPSRQRKYHTCSACRTFITRYGGLVTLTDTGAMQSAIWHLQDTPALYQPGVLAMRNVIRRATVTGVFASSETIYGQPVTGVWHHLSVTPPRTFVYRSKTKTAQQWMAEKREDYYTVMSALTEFSLSTVKEAVRLLTSESLYRADKVIEPAEWLLRLHEAWMAAKGSAARSNVVWLAIATAPAGFCHPKSSMIGTLLEDIASRQYDFAEVERRFRAKMHPLQYQRPQAPPKAGTIDRAETLVEQMGVAASLRRRYARLDDLEAYWRPSPPPPDPDRGMFGHLKNLRAPEPTTIILPAQTMTWRKFAETVLPKAESIDYYVGYERDGFATLVTAADPDAPPILQWDTEAVRNPVSWYFWHHGSTPESFGLIAGRFYPVDLITLKPPMWHNRPHPPMGQGVMFVLHGAADTHRAGTGLFPEMLKAEFHEIRAVVEAYSKRQEIEDAGGVPAAGIMLQQGKKWDTHLRVTSRGETLDYKLDRWD
jgi:hypothetical protein